MSANRIVIESQFIPPSSNAAYRNPTASDHVRHRIKTKRYGEWARAFQWDCLAQVPVKDRLKGPYEISITIDRATRHKLTDLANREKVLSDALVGVGIIEDDRFCERLSMAWGEAKGGIRVEIEAVTL